MLNNDVMRSLRYLLKTDDTHLAELIALGGGTTSRLEVTAFLMRDDEPGYVVCSNRVMNQLLDGLILKLRGPADPSKPKPAEHVFGNNTVLKKLRVAFKLNEDELLKLMAASGFEVSKPELSALFRNPEHKNFRPAGDQFLRNFLKSLTAKVRP
jgi:uncharacterized protein YehS (DUF1456 family)